MSHQNSINTEVATRIASIAPQISEKVIDHLVSKELVRRTDAVIQALSEVEKLGKDLIKMKPDNTLYNDDGSVASSSWTKPKLEEKNKLVAKIQKINVALEKALGENDFNLLFSLQKPQDV